MKKEYGKEYETDEERIAFLEDNADSVESKEYFKRFTPQELKEKKDRKIEVDVEVADLDEEKKAKMKEFKDKIDPLAKEGKLLLKCIKKKGEVISGRLFKFIEPEEKMVGFYDEQGDLIESRPAFPDELQTTIYQLNRTGTND